MRRRFLPNTITTGEVTHESLLQCVRGAYNNWLAIILSHKVMKRSTNEETYTVLSQLLLLFAYPTTMGVQVQPDGVIQFSLVSVFPTKWGDLAAAGAFRIVLSNDSFVDLYKPKRFLLCWVTESFAQKVLLYAFYIIYINKLYSIIKIDQVHPQTLMYS